MLRGYLRFAAIVGVPLFLVACGGGNSSDGAQKSSPIGVEQASQQSNVVSNAEVTFPDPDAAITYFIDTLKRGDGHAALLAFSIDRRVEGYSFTEMAKGQGATSPTRDVPPLRYDLYKYFADPIYTSRAASSIIYVILGLILPDGYDLLGTTSFGSGDSKDMNISDYEKLVDPYQLSTIKLIKTGRAMYSTPKALQDFSLLYTRKYGGDEYQERTALVELNGLTTVIGFTLVRYEREWQIFDLSALYSRLQNGETRRMSVEEYDRSVALN